MQSESTNAKMIAPQYFFSNNNVDEKIRFIERELLRNVYMVLVKTNTIHA
jgi:hypothetical protein